MSTATALPAGLSDAREQQEFGNEDHQGILRVTLERTAF